jgi:hypothetical protein
MAVALNPDVAQMNGAVVLSAALLAAACAGTSVEIEDTTPRPPAPTAVPTVTPTPTATPVAGVPSAFRSTIGPRDPSGAPVLLGLTSGAYNDTTGLFDWSEVPDGTLRHFHAVIRDGFGSPVPDALVVLDFSGVPFSASGTPGIDLFTLQRAGVSVDCADRRLSLRADASGVVDLPVNFCGFSRTAAVNVYGDGVLLGSMKARSTDADCITHTTNGDLSWFLSFETSADTDRGDLDLDGAAVCRDPQTGSTTGDCTTLMTIRFNFNAEYSDTYPIKFYCREQP